MLLIDFLGAQPTDLTTASTGQNLKLQNLGWIQWKDNLAISTAFQFHRPSGPDLVACRDRKPSAQRSDLPQQCPEITPI